jgi:hypothetical protein
MRALYSTFRRVIPITFALLVSGALVRRLDGVAHLFQVATFHFDELSSVYHLRTCLAMPKIRKRPHDSVSFVVARGFYSPNASAALSVNALAWRTYLSTISMLFVTGLPHNLSFRFTRSSSTGHEAGTQAVPGDVFYG